MTEVLIFTSAFLLTYFGVKIFRAWSLKKGMLDIPNDRSSHTTPTPRGGGLVLVLVTLTFYGIISFLEPEFFSWGYLAGAVLVALLQA